MYSKRGITVAAIASNAILFPQALWFGFQIQNRLHAGIPLSVVPWNWRREVVRASRECDTPENLSLEQSASHFIKSHPL